MAAILSRPQCVKVVTCCRQTTSHYLSQCWSRSVSPEGVTRPQWVEHNTRHDIIFVCFVIVSLFSACAKFDCNETAQFILWVYLSWTWNIWFKNFQSSSSYVKKAATSFKSGHFCEILSRSTSRFNAISRVSSFSWAWFRHAREWH